MLTLQHKHWPTIQINPEHIMFSLQIFTSAYLKYIFLLSLVTDILYENTVAYINYLFDEKNVYWLCIP